MEYKKSMIIIILAIFLLSIASVCASDANDTAIASEDTTAIELSQSEEITPTDESQKTIQTNDTEILTANDEETTATQNNLDTLSLEEKTYEDLSNAVGSGGDINLQPAYYKYNGESDTITITNPGIINGNGAIIDMAGSTIRAFNVNTAGVTIKNLTIKNTKYNGDGGAIYFAQSGSVINCNFANNTADGNGGAISFTAGGSVTNCNFTNNKATADRCGGAIYFRGTGDVTNCNFTSNEAYSGGAIYFNYDERHEEDTVTNCNFVNNTATDGGAIYFFCSSGNVTNCNFVYNRATGEYGYGGAIYFSYGSTGTVENCNFIDNSAINDGGAIYFESDSFTRAVKNCNFTNNSASNQGGAIYFAYGYTYTVENCNFDNNHANEWGGAIYSYKDLGVTADTCIFKTDSDSNYQVHILPPTLNVDNFTDVFNSGRKLTFDLKTNSNRTVNNGNISISVYYKNNNNWVGNYSCLSGEGWTVDLPADSYYAVFSTEYAGFEPINRTINVSKSKTQLAASAVTATYNVKKNLVITLKDANGNVLSGVEVTVKIKKAKTYTTDKNGKIKINVAKLVPKKYTAKISFAGNANYIASSANAKVTVKKAKPKLTAKKKTFKVKKAKKYTITLKTNNKKALKKGKVTLTTKVKGKKIKITKKTSKKGKATFNLKKLTKKGKYTATVKFAGSKYYKATTKKVKITVK